MQGVLLNKVRADLFTITLAVITMTLSFSVPLTIREKAIKLELKKMSLFKPYMFPIWWAIVVVFILIKGPGEYHYTHDGITETKQVNLIFESFCYICFATLLILLRRKVIFNKAMKIIRETPSFQEERQITVNENDFEINGDSFNLKQPISSILKISKLEEFHYFETNTRIPFIIPINVEGSNRFIQIICDQNKISVC